MTVKDLNNAAYIIVLEARIGQLENRIRELTAMLAEPDIAPWPEEWRLTRTENLFLLTLRSGELVSYQDIMRSMYPDRAYPPGLKIIHVMACKLRKRLVPFGKSIENVWGRGMRLIDVHPVTPALQEVTHESYRPAAHRRNKD